MAEFRKVGLRMFIKVEGSIMIQVLNKVKYSSVSIQDNATLSGSYIAFKEEYQPCTEEEFNVAYKDALAVIQIQKI